MKHFSLRILLLSSLILLIHSFDINKEIVRTMIRSDEEAEKIGQYFVKFAAFSYCDVDRVTNQHKCCHMDVDPEEKSMPNTEGETKGGWTLVKHSKSNTGDREYKDKYNTYSIFKSDTYKKTVISFSGTQELSQLGKEELFNRKVLIQTCVENDDAVCISNYFYKRIADLYNDISKLKSQSGLDKGYQLIVTGHSLGGASSLVFVYLAVSKGLVSRETNKPIIVTYGQPKTGNYEFILEMERYTEAIFRFINQADVVPHSPPFGLYTTDYRGILKGIKAEYFHTFHYYNVTTKGKVQKETILSFLFPKITTAINTCLDLIDVITTKKVTQQLELLKKKNGTTLLEENDLLAYLGEDYNLRAELDDKYDKEISDYIIWIAEKAALFGMGAVIHTKYFNIKVGSYCSEGEYKSSNYVSFKYLLILSFITLILF